MNKKFTGTAAGSFLEANGYDGRVLKELKKRMDRLIHLDQLEPPRRAAFSKMQPSQAYSGLENLKDELFKEMRVRATNDLGYWYLLQFENFQNHQKGGAAPATYKELTKSIEILLTVSDRDLITKEAKNILPVAAKRLTDQLVHEGLRETLHLSMLQPLDAGDSMDGSTGRGLPVLSRGNKIIEMDGRHLTVDEHIMYTFGNDIGRLVYALKDIKNLLSVPGIRIQGTPEGEPAKVRIIHMPTVQYMYTMRPFQVAIQSILKDRSQLGYAWHEPAVYQEKLKTALNDKNAKFCFISLDYSKFDSRLAHQFRELAFDVLSNVMFDSSIPGKTELQNSLKRLWLDEYVCLPNKATTIAILQTPNLLLSGDVFTQLIGNLCNRLMQYAIASALRYDFPDELGLELGDDTALPYPRVGMEEKGYDNVLKDIESVINTGGSTMNVAKQYPTYKTVIFLQHLYGEEYGIGNEYSLIRSVESLVYTERPRERIEGVMNYNALETIGQISVLNNIPFSTGNTTNKDLLGSIIIPRWLGIDRAFHALVVDSLKLAKNDVKVAARYGFSYLIACVGGRDAVITGMKLRSFDKNGMLGILTQNVELLEAMPILLIITNTVQSLKPVTFDYTSVYATETKIKLSPKVGSQYLDQKRV